MKKMMLLLTCVAGFVLVAYKTKTPPAVVPPEVSNPPAIISPMAPSKDSEYTVDHQQYRFALFTVNNPKTLTLIPNFSQKASSLSIAESNKCKALISGGFYSKDNNPIGLFATNGTQLGAYQPNVLFNGFFSVDTNGDATIGNEIPDPTSRLALQSGPLLITDGSTRKLAIRDDEPARRIVVAQTSDDNIIFLALFGNENSFEGPKLADVPKHLKEIETLLGISLMNAINLDGGSASAFITKDHSLTELTTVGSFFCIQ